MRGTLLAAFIVLPNGQRSIAWFSGGALIATLLLVKVSAWYKAQNAGLRARTTVPNTQASKNA